MSADERKDENGGDPQTSAEGRGGVITPPWVPNAWEMRIVGMQAWEAIGAAVGHDARTVQKWVVFYSQMLGEVADNEDVIHARAEYVASLQRIKRQAEEVVLAASGVGGQPFAKIGALNTKLRASEKLAAAKGVVTERKSEEKSTSPGDPLLEVLKRFAPNEIAEELGNGRFGGGSAADPGGGAGRDPAPSGGEATTAEGGA